MTDAPVSRDELVTAREALIADTVGKMPEAHRQFLISFEAGEPDWPLLGLPNAPELPVVRWRQQNRGKLCAEKRAALTTRLQEVLFSPEKTRRT